MSATIKLQKSLARSTIAVPCPARQGKRVCSGYAGQVRCTKAEIASQSCDFGKKGHACCVRAFKCRICGARIVAELDAPEYE